MLGMFTGEFIKLRKEGLTDKRKVAGLVLAGVLLLLVGVLWSLVFPINKKLWSSSFVCVVGAYSVWMFALFYYIVDVLGWRKWTFFFQVIGLIRLRSIWRKNSSISLIHPKACLADLSDGCRKPRSL